MVAFLPVMGVGQVASAKVHPVVVFNICDRYAARRDRPHPPARASPALPPDGDAPTALERATRTAARSPRRVASTSARFADQLFRRLPHHEPLPRTVRSFIRRQETQSRVIGTLLGSVNPDGSADVRNSYAVPHNEQNGQVFVDVEFHRAMAELHGKVNPTERVIGWYSTGDGVVPTDALIHEFFAHECASPVHVTLDVGFGGTEGTLMRAWTGKSVAIGAADAADAKAAAAAAVTAPRGEEEGSNAGSRGGSEAAKRADGAAKAEATAPPPAATHFQEISVTNVFDAAERVGVSLLANEATDKVPSEKAGLEKTVRKLSAMLDKTAAYVASVVDGKTEPNAEIGRFLADALASVPRLTQEQFEKVFGDAIQDVLLVMYLSNVTKMHLMLAEKLQTASLLV